jgi:hypothetical protein
MSTLEQLIISLVQDKMQDSSCFADATALLWKTELDSVVDDSETYELCKLRENLAKSRESLQSHLENPDSPYASYLGLDGLYWALRFSWADLQDYVEEANSKLINEMRGFPDVPYYFTELADGTHVPCRPQIYRRQTLHDYRLWSESDEFPVVAWDEEDYRAATEDYPLEDEEDSPRVPWEDYDQDDLNKMDLQLRRGY